MIWEWLDNRLNSASLRVRKRKSQARFARIEANLFEALREVHALGKAHDRDMEHLHLRQDIKATLQQLQRYRVTWGLLPVEKVKEEIKRCLRQAV